MDHTTDNAVQREDQTDLAVFQPKSSRKIEREFKVVGGLVLDRVVQEDAEDLIIGNRVEGQERISKEVNDGLASKNALLMLTIGLMAVLRRDHLAGEKRGSSLSIHEGGSAC